MEDSSERRRAPTLDILPPPTRKLCTAIATFIRDVFKRVKERYMRRLTLGEIRADEQDVDMEDF